MSRRSDNSRHPIASARRLLAFMPPRLGGLTRGEGDTNENPGPYIALTEVWRPYGNPYGSGLRLKISHYVIDLTRQNYLDRDLEHVVATEIDRFQAVEGRGRIPRDERYVTRVRVHPQSIVEISSHERDHPQLRVALQALDLAGLARLCGDSSIFERTPLDRISDSLIDSETIEHLLPASIGAIPKIDVSSWRSRHGPIIRSFASARYPRNGESADPRDGDHVWVLDYGTADRVMFPLGRDLDISGVHSWFHGSHEITKLQGVIVHHKRLSGKNYLKTRSSHRWHSPRLMNFRPVVRFFVNQVLIRPLRTFCFPERISRIACKVIESSPLE